jgi:site-specific DNA recombinase
VAKSEAGCDESRAKILATVGRVDIAPGEIKVALSPEGLASLLHVERDKISEELLGITSEFKHRKRGVDTKLILENAAAPRDETLFRNIARAHRYFDMILAGQTFGEIAEGEGVSKRRVQQLIELAFLAPDVIRDTFDGRQPTGLTSEWLFRHSFTPVWHEQREMFRAL